MNTNELACIAQCMLRKGKDNPANLKFYGVFAKDKAEIFIAHLCKTFEHPSSIIVNTHDSSQPGEHWIALTFLSRTCIEFFDSFANTPETYSFRFAKFFTSVYYTPFQIQQDGSDRCGHHCLYYLHNRAKLLSAHALCVKHFLSSSLQSNDKVVSRFVTSHRKRCSLSNTHTYKHLCFGDQCCHSRTQ